MNRLQPQPIETLIVHYRARSDLRWHPERVGPSRPAVHQVPTLPGVLQRGDRSECVYSPGCPLRCVQDMLRLICTCALPRNDGRFFGLSEGRPFYCARTSLAGSWRGDRPENYGTYSNPNWSELRRQSTQVKPDQVDREGRQKGRKRGRNWTGGRKRGRRPDRGTETGTQLVLTVSQPPRSACLPPLLA